MERYRALNGLVCYMEDDLDESYTITKRPYKGRFVVCT
ncbi:MAG: hypothetical protein K0R47_3925 [Brevibacillus sp.]|nr:hypothetical protein [Brevibacillus sp.]